MQVNQVSMQYQSVSLNTRKEHNPQSTQGLKESYSMNARFVTFTMQSRGMSGGNVSAQNALFNMINGNTDIKDFLSGVQNEGMFSLSDLGYQGKPILSLNPNEASSLLEEGGFFSVENTAQRAIDFVLAGGGDDIERLKAGRSGIVRGFEEAERLWGGRLPDIAYETQKLTLEKIDEKIQSLGGSAFDMAA
ncbi:MAG: hydrogenase-4 component G [Epsilonproteobacteria bacterium]|nr:hydrogenase-4 component G [Campylobacterota bacterium]